MTSARFIPQRWNILLDLESRCASDCLSEWLDTPKGHEHCLLVVTTLNTLNRLPDLEGTAPGRLATLQCWCPKGINKVCLSQSQFSLGDMDKNKLCDELMN